MYYEVIPTRLFRQDSGVLTYSSDRPLQPGHIVLIPLGRSTTPGIVAKSVPQPDFPTKPIIKLLYETPLPHHLLKSIFWLSDFYLSPLPSVAALFLPNGVEKTRRRATTPLATATTLATPKPDNHPSFHQIPLNPHQKNALKALQEASGATKLLRGVTGSGKTNIYLKLAENALKTQKSAIILVPEIALTSQLVQIFSQTFAERTVVLHSRQTEAERHLAFESILNASEPLIIIGPRSALFAPVKNLGLIIIDEAHEPSYYQENSPKYSSLRLASFIAQTNHISCVLGTATPSVVDYYLAKSKNSLISLSEKAKTTAIKPQIQIINLTDRQNFTKNRYFSDQLLQKITENLQNHHQTLIFHNRRGSAPLTICEKCGYQALCPTCFLPLTLHSDTFSLVCHTCGYQTPLMHDCPNCHHASIIHKGFGTKLLESELKKLFKTAKIARFDADTAKSESLNSLYNQVKSGDFDIIIGTQTIAKGLDLPHLATVGVVQADSGLSLPDFSAEERTFELISQVIGRVGRGHINSADVIIQTFQPDHPAINFALSENYPAFAEYLIKKRRTGHLPPFTYLAKISVTYKTESITIQKIRQIHRALKQSAPKTVVVSAPTPAFHERTSTGFTWQIVLRSTSRSDLLKILQSVPASAKPHFAIDPPSLL